MTATASAGFITALIVSSVFAGCENAPQSTPAEALAEDDEYQPPAENVLVRKIRQATSDAERRELIGELEALPNRQRMFYDEGWTDQGYDQSKSDLARDLQLLWATHYGIMDIENGGFHQFFSNSKIARRGRHLTPRGGPVRAFCRCLHSDPHKATEKTDRNAEGL